MRLFRALWRDESGVLLSAEAVVVGTVGVVGLTAGLTVVAESVNKELEDVAFAIRSLDQSYTIPAQKGCGACTAGSKFTQQPVKKSLQQLREVAKEAEKQAKSQAERLEEKVDGQKRKKDTDKKKKKEQEQDV